MKALKAYVNHGPSHITLRVKYADGTEISRTLKMHHARVRTLAASLRQEAKTNPLDILRRITSRNSPFTLMEKRK